VKQAKIKELSKADNLAPALLQSNEEPTLPHLMGRTLLAIKQVMEKEMGVNMLTARIMLLLARQDGMSQNQLTGCIGVDASMITRTVKEMEKELGWVRRERDSQDNRLMRVFLTEKGQGFAQIIPQKTKQLEQRVTQKISQADLTQLRVYLHVLEDTARYIYEDMSENNNTAN